MFFSKTKSKKNIYVMTTSLPMTYGGRTSALLQRCRLLTSNNKNVNHATLLTTNYNPDYEYVYNDYRKKGTVNDKITFKNVYDDFKWVHNNKIKQNYKKYLLEEFGNELTGFKKKESSHVTFFYKNGTPLYYLSYNKSKNRMGHIDVFLNQHTQSAKRLYMNKDGNIHKIRYFKDKEEENVVRDVFVDCEMNAYLTREYLYKNNKLTVNKNILFLPNKEIQVFNSNNELISYWFQSILEDGDLVINDVRALDKPLMMQNKCIRKIFQMHGPHLTEPTNINSSTKKGFDFLFNNVNKDEDIIVALTKAQKRDIISKYSFLKDKITVIPHCIEESIRIQHEVKPKTACIVSRLVKSKRIDHAIIAFSNVLKVKNDWNLNIYGEGEEKEELEKLVTKLGIEDSVHFMGFTKEPNKAFQTSEFSIMTSLFEGYGLTIMESIVNGCPVISYDFNWGPSEIIDEQTGILVESGNTAELEKAMLKIIDKPLNRKNVLKSYKKFEREAFLKKWDKLISSQE